jgi:hypothetical protein
MDRLRVWWKMSNRNNKWALNSAWQKNCAENIDCQICIFCCCNRRQCNCNVLQISFSCLQPLGASSIGRLEILSAAGYGNKQTTNSLTVGYLISHLVFGVGSTFFRRTSPYISSVYSGVVLCCLRPITTPSINNTVVEGAKSAQDMRQWAGLDEWQVAFDVYGFRPRAVSRRLTNKRVEWIMNGKRSTGSSSGAGTSPAVARPTADRPADRLSVRQASSGRQRLLRILRCNRQL